MQEAYDAYDDFQSCPPIIRSEIFTAMYQSKIEGEKVEILKLVGSTKIHV
jgi:hypothetical protein